MLKKLMTAVLISVMALMPASVFADTNHAAAALKAYEKNNITQYDRLVKGLPRYSKSAVPTGEAAEQYKLKIRQFSPKKLSQVEFLNIGGSKTPEMIVETGTCEADYQFHFYTYENGKVVKLGKMNAGHTYLFRIPGKKGVYLHFAQMGYENIRRVRLVNGNLAKNTEMKERKVKNYNNFRNMKYTLQGVKTSFWK